MKSEQAITVFAEWRVREGQLNTVLNLLREVVQKSTAEDGNLLYNIHQSQTEANTLILFERYKDEAALAAHRNSEHFQTLVVGKIVPLLEDRKIILSNQLVFE
ncbi:MAG: putative quinol monooxygenase [Mucilaginibacter sp.]|uniref:putative quinol monooxygenase n=1 Tax=Mucilaginibacter sp. TaxID=1882438 RepID=UPI0031AD67AB